MKKLLLILAATLIAWSVSAQWNIEGYTVYKDNGLERFTIQIDSIKFKQARAMRLKGTKKFDFYRIVNQLAHQVFTEDDLICLSKGFNESDARCSAYIQHDGTITIKTLYIPYKDEKIFTQDKIEKWMKFWEGKDFKDYVELTQKPDIPEEEFVGVFLFHFFYVFIPEDKKYRNPPYNTYSHEEIKPKENTTKYSSFIPCVCKKTKLQ